MAQKAHITGNKGQAVTVLPSLKNIIVLFLAVQKARTWWAAGRPTPSSARVPVCHEIKHETAQ